MRTPARSTSFFRAVDGAADRSAPMVVDERSLLRLLEVDAELAEAVPEHERARAARALAVPTLTLGAGLQQLDQGGLPANTFALMLTSGFAAREVSVEDRAVGELLGPGDVVLPWDAPDDMLGAQLSFMVHEPVRIAVLDEGFLVIAARWPGLMRAVQRRLSDQSHRLALHGIICQLPSVEQRLLALLWHLSARWGKVVPGAVLLPLHMTHASMGRVLGAHRSTVTLALTRLRTEGRLERRSDGAWLLLDGSLDEALGEVALAGGR